MKKMQDENNYENAKQNLRNQQHIMRMQHSQEELTQGEQLLIVIQDEWNKFNSLKTPQKDSVPNNTNNRRTATVGETKCQEGKSESNESYTARLNEDDLVYDDDIKDMFG